MAKPAPDPTVPPPQPKGLNQVLARNIAALGQRRREDAAVAGLEARIADRITTFTGSLRFVYLHLAGVGFWILANLGWVPAVPRWDPEFIVLAMIASVEAIFLSTFVLISQNRMAQSADQRAELDLQISLLTEHEITKLVAMVEALSRRVGLELRDGEVVEIKRDVAPEAVLDAIEASAGDRSA